MRKLVLAATFTLAATAGFPAAAQTGNVIAAKGPGAVEVAQTVDVTATITAIDAASRAITVKGPQGKEVTVTAGPEVKNFAQLKVGDKVDLTYAEALTLELKKGGGFGIYAVPTIGVSSIVTGDATLTYGGGLEVSFWLK